LIGASALVDDNGRKLLEVFQAAMKTDHVKIARQSMEFMLALDYDALHGAPLDAKLAEYDNID